MRHKGQHGSFRSKARSSQFAFSDCPLRRREVGLESLSDEIDRWSAAWCKTGRKESGTESNLRNYCSKSLKSVERRDSGQNSRASAPFKQTVLRRMMRADQCGRMPPAGTAFVKNYQFRMKIVGERNREKQQNQSAGECGPFTQRIAAISRPLVQPSRAPKAKGDCGDRHP
jgi:hypothetical protein